VARAKFLAERRDIVRRFVAAHRELTGWIAQNAAEAQRMAREELRTAFRSDFAAELIARAWSRMTPTAEISLAAFEAFVKSAQQLGFLRNVPDLARLVEAP
jgi:sulfonate transport system substrate-binding protein